MNKVDEILKQYPYIGEDIQKAQREINRYIDLQQEARNPLKAQALTGMPHDSGVSDQTYNAIVKLIDVYQTEIDKYVAEVNELITLQKWLDKAFTALTEDERRTLYQKYDQHMAIGKIAYTGRMCRDTVYKILDSAKEKIKKIVL